MPRYDYKCDECYAVCEIEHSMDETPEIRCFTCGDKMRKLMSKPNFIIKVYRGDDLEKKKDSKTAERDYKRKLKLTG